MGVNFIKSALVSFSLVLLCSSVGVADQFDQAYFSAIKGDWVGDGEVLNAAPGGDGAATPIHEEWSAGREDDRFVIRGTRLAGEETQEFRWIFTFNASTELYECEYWHTGMETELIFEVSLNGNRAELRTAFGENGGELLVSNLVKENRIEGLVEVSNRNGETFTIAKMTHTGKGE